MRPPSRLPLGTAAAPSRSGWKAPVSILAGSAMTLLPVVATIPILPPFGLMMLMAWRLLRPDVFRPWAPLLFGLFDDLLSGQPLGSAMLLWTICFVAVDVVDSRLVWRDFWQNWLIAAAAIAFCLSVGRLIATPFGAHVDTVLLLQILVSIALFPLTFLLCARLDGRERRS
ncbi:rod shape-determining protein MreD [Stakelama saccharophila]|uniref:Rod shape-determining protein MreD n=1 Tax=Stakelama saccharophila TaxID=3075605 RepID=A0ABZ0B738_9SPHN|nr:rod shape-determining protein MreD [Stakelama sp. W311]WNO52436.1 rod shape-determining protein MreD [Stakelama sp. W311]